MSIIWYMFLSMTNGIVCRNARFGDTSRLSRFLLSDELRRRGGATVLWGGWTIDLRKLPRFSRVLSCPLDEASDREPWKRMRWWSHGAFGSKGRLEGAQYLAGRRAPPLLLHR
jgi:hypothetical protein